jgi:hypothetical protein
MVTDTPPHDAYVAIQYGRRWFWIADNDIQSKYTFGIVMLRFSIARHGRGSACRHDPRQPVTVLVRRVRMRTQPASFDDNPPAIDAAVKKPPGLPSRIGTRLLHETRQALPPTIFFFVGFNFVVFTNLLLADYAVAVSSFMLATVAALVVGKAVLVANAMPYLRR